MVSAASIGNALRTARQARHLSLSDVSAKAGMSVATLSRIETGKQNVDLPLLVTLSAILGISPAALLDGNGDARGPGALAEELAMLSPSQRARVLASALKQSRHEGTREALHARVESLVTTLDLVRDELVHLRKELRRGK